MGQFVYTPPPSRVAVEDLPGAPKRFSFAAHVIHVGAWVLAAFWLWLFVSWLANAFLPVRFFELLAHYTDMNLYVPFWKHLSFGVIGRYAQFLTQPAMMILWRTAIAFVLLVLCFIFSSRTKASHWIGALSLYTVAVLVLDKARTPGAHFAFVCIGVALSLVALNAHRKARKEIQSFFFGA